MANQRAVYDPELRETQEFKILYGRYYSSGTTKYREAFATFQEFYDWSMANGFVNGARLGRKDPNKPYCKENCIWEPPIEKKSVYWADEREEAIKKWNATVNRIRVHYGLKPF